MKTCIVEGCDSEVHLKYNSNGRVINNRQTRCELHKIGSKIGRKGAFSNFSILHAHTKKRLKDISEREIRDVYPMFNLCPVLGIQLSMDTIPSADNYPFVIYHNDELLVVSTKVGRLLKTYELKDLMQICQFMAK